MGWAIGGWHGALTALLWAGLVRITLLQHVTWSVYSLCHVIGARPFTTRRIFERLGWATGVHWPVPARLDCHRRDQGRPRRHRYFRTAKRQPRRHPV